MPSMARLYHKIARDEAFLESTLDATGRHDAFTGSLLRLLRDSRAARRAQQAAGTDVTLALLRSDYMLDAPSGG